MMKHLSYLFVLICCIFVFSHGVANAQDESHAYVAVTYKAIMPDDGTVAERDSLLSEWTEAVTKKNDKILSSTNLRHFFGSDNRDWVVFVEYESFADIAEAIKVNQELAKKRWPNEKERSEFFQKLGKYFLPLHSDEIYTALPKFDK